MACLADARALVLDCCHDMLESQGAMAAMILLLPEAARMNWLFALDLQAWLPRNDGMASRSSEYVHRHSSWRCHFFGFFKPLASSYGLLIAVAVVAVIMLIMILSVSYLAG